MTQPEIPSRVSAASAVATEPILSWTSGYKAPRLWKTISIVFFAVVYIGGATGRWWPSNDSAVYLGLGRSIAQGQGYIFNGEPNNSFTPGLPLLLASLRLLGDQSIWGPNFLMALSGVAGLWLIYVALKRATGDEMLALLIAIVCGASYAFYFNAHRVLTDMPCTAIFWLLLWCLLRVEKGTWGWIALAGLLSILVVVMRAPAIILLGPLALGILLDNWLIPSWRKRLATALVIGLAALATASVFFLLARQMNSHAPHYVKIMTPSMGAIGFWRRLIHGVAMMPRAAADVFTSQPSAWPAGVLFLAAQAIGAIRCWRAGRRSIVIVAVLYPLLLAVSLGTFGMRGRYMTPVFPLMLLLATDGVCWTVARIYQWRKWPIRPAVFAVVVAVYCGASFFSNGPRSSRNAFYYTLMSYSPNFYHAIREGRYAQLAAIAERLGQEPGEGLAAASAEDLAVLNFLSQRRVVPLEEPSAKADPLAPARDLLTQDARVRFVVLNLPKNLASSATQPDALPGLKIIYRDGTYVLGERP